MAHTTDKSGFVYVVVNPRFRGFCKIGFAHQPYERLRVMNTHDPDRGFTFYHLEPTGDRRDAEDFIHRLLDTRRHKRTEWYLIHPDDAVHAFQALDRRDELDRVLPVRRARVPIAGRKQVRDQRGIR